MMVFMVSVGLSNYNQFASLIHRIPSEGFESKAASSDGKTESDSGTVIGPFGISLFLAEWDEPLRARGDRRQSVPDELPRIHEAFAPLPPKDWHRFAAGPFRCRNPLKLRPDPGWLRIGPCAGFLREVGRFVLVPTETPDNYPSRQ